MRSNINNINYETMKSVQSTDQNALAYVIFFNLSDNEIIGPGYLNWNALYHLVYHIRQLPLFTLVLSSVKWKCQLFSTSLTCYEES